MIKHKSRLLHNLSQRPHHSPSPSPSTPHIAKLSAPSIRSYVPLLLFVFLLDDIQVLTDDTHRSIHTLDGVQCVELGFKGNLFIMLDAF